MMEQWNDGCSRKAAEAPGEQGTTDPPSPVLTSKGFGGRAEALAHAAQAEAGSQRSQRKCSFCWTEKGGGEACRPARPSHGSGDRT